MPSPHDTLLWQVFLLLEHKRTADPWTAFQLLRYVVRILEQFRKEQPRAPRIPPIVAMVVHHSVKGWRSSTELIDLFDLDDLTRPVLGPYLPQLRFRLDDLSRATPDQLGARTLIRAELGPELEQTMTSTYDQLINEGLAKGKAEALLKVLEKRFGSLPADAVIQVHAADLEALDRWLLRFVDAQTLDEVFAED